MAITLLGFSSGLPLLLVFSTLSLWLKDAGISKTAIGLFALVRAPYTFKFLWAPLMDRVPLPFLTRRLGRRRGWTLAAQVALALSILALAGTDPASAPFRTAVFALLVAFCSASQDVVVDAFRVESLPEREQGAGAGAIVLGYRMGMLASGAGAIWLAAFLSWAEVYALMALLTVVGMATILLVREPTAPGAARNGPVTASGAGWFEQAVLAPLRDFLGRPRWGAILLFIALFKLGDAYLGVMANPFYVEAGFSKAEIATVSKVFGMGATIVGGLVGGVVVYHMGIFRSLILTGVLQMLSNLVFAAQAMIGHHVPMLMVTIATENVTGAMATAAFVAYLSSLCNVAYTATQYALLSSLMAFARDVLAASSGFAAEQLGWVPFFLVTTVAAVPGLALLVLLRPGVLPSPEGTPSTQPDSSRETRARR